MFILAGGTLGPYRRDSDSVLLLAYLSNAQISDCKLHLINSHSHCGSGVSQYSHFSGQDLSEMTKFHLPRTQAIQHATEQDTHTAVSRADMEMFFRTWMDAPETAVDYANRFADRYAATTGRNSRKIKAASSTTDCRLRPANSAVRTGRCRIHCVR